MNLEFTLIKSEPDVQQGFVTRTYGLHIYPSPAERMAVLNITTHFEGVEEAIALFADRSGQSLGQNALLVSSGQPRSSVLHVPAHTGRLLIALTMPAAGSPDRLSARLNYPGRLAGVGILAVYVYRINRQRGVSLPRFFLEKTLQLRRLGLRHLLKSPSRHVQLREFTSPDYLNWIRRSTENLLASGSLAYGERVIRLAVFVEAETVGDDLRSSIAALGELRNARVTAYVLGAESPPEHPTPCSQPGVEVMLLQAPGATAAIQASARQSDWCCFIKAGDIIRPHALHVLGQYCSSHDDVSICYSDHDCLQDGERHSPWFKPRWSPEYFRNFDYIGRAVFYRGDWVADRVQTIAGVIAVHTKLILESSRTRPDQIHRIPDVLFSFPEHPDVRVGENRRGIVSRHLDAQGILHAWQAGVDGVSEGFVDYSPGFAGAFPKVSIIVPTRDQLRLLKPCVEGVFDFTRYPDFELIIVDNGSRERRTLAYLDACAARPRCTVLSFEAPFNFAAINNFAVDRATGELVCLLNNDIELFRADWLSRMVAYFALPDIGAVGAKLLYRDRRVQHAGVICGLGNVAGHAHRYSKACEDGYMNRLQVPGEFSAVTAACLLTRRSLYQALGGLNARELAVAYNDVDYCLELGKAGFRVIFAPQVEAFHLESKSRGSEDTDEKQQRYRGETAYMWQKWRQELEDDAFYNPNLTRVREDFSIAAAGMPVPGLESARGGQGLTRVRKTS